MRTVSKCVVYLWGGGSTVPMKLSVPNTLNDSGIVGVSCGRSQRAGVTEDGKLLFWEVSEQTSILFNYQYVGNSENHY